MTVYRLSKKQFASDLTGEGARLFGGRWNHIHTGCLYTSASRALALLEFSVNVNRILAPKSLCIVTLEISEKNMLKLDIRDLPGNWQEVPAPGSTRDFGTGLLQEARYSVIAIPSVIVPDEYNYLLNPLHKDHAKLRITAVRELDYDGRIKAGPTGQK
ncbi:MAG: RES family NAD+ phosphorylase [Sphingobacteriia bacterium]|nr:RES family NAD+ phosphorylase [Sphingobacteriia bacterium]